MRSIGDPDYVYRPLSSERRANMRAASLKRLGIPAGHHRLYGVNVPDEHYEALRRLAHAARRNGMSKARCRTFVRAMLVVISEAVTPQVITTLRVKGGAK